MPPQACSRSASLGTPIVGAINKVREAILTAIPQRMSNRSIVNLLVRPGPVRLAPGSRGFLHRFPLPLSSPEFGIFGCVAIFKKHQESDGSGRSGAVSCNHVEQLVDELNLLPNIRTAHPPRLSLPDHVHCLVSLDRSPRRLKLTKSLLGLHTIAVCSDFGSHEDKDQLASKSQNAWYLNYIKEMEETIARHDESRRAKRLQNEERLPARPAAALAEKPTERGRGHRKVCTCNYSKGRIFSEQLLYRCVVGGNSEQVYVTPHHALPLVLRHLIFAQQKPRLIRTRVTGCSLTNASSLVEPIRNFPAAHGRTPSGRSSVFPRVGGHRTLHSAACRTP